MRGQRFGKLVIVELSHLGTRNRAFWNCLCDCGNYKIVPANRLRFGKTKSCGCSYIDAANRRILPDSGAAKNELYGRYKRTALSRGYVFDLSFDAFMFITSSICFYCGKEPSQITKAKGKGYGNYTYNGVDRLDNTKGYTLENSVACCMLCNRSKNVMSYAEYIAHCHTVITTHEERKAAA